jgi:hypothetical protein
MSDELEWNFADNDDAKSRDPSRGRPLPDEGLKIVARGADKEDQAAA